MGKLLLAVAAVVSLAFTPNEGARNVPPQPEIIISPMPPVAGQSMQVEYTGQLPATIDLDWHPKGSPTSVTIDRSGKATVTVPRGATSLWASDPSGEADSVQTVVQ